MSNWRLKTLFNDRSQRSLPSQGAGIGGTVVKTKFGPQTPVLFNKGESLRIQKIFGEVHPKYGPSLLEALAYNDQYSLYLSSVGTSFYNAGYSGVVATISSGAVTVNALPGVMTTDPDEVKNTATSLNSIRYIQNLSDAPSDDGVELLSTLPAINTFPTAFDDIEITISAIKTDGTEIEISDAATYDSSATTTFTFTGLDSSVDQYITAASITSSGTISLTTDDAEQDKYDYVFLSITGTWNYPLFAVFSRAQEDDRFEANLTYANSTLNLTIQNSTDSSVFDDNSNEIALTTGATDGFGRNIFLETVYNNHPLFKALVYDTSSSVSSVTNTSAVDFNGGRKDIDDIVDSDYADTYDNYTTQNVDVFFDATSVDDLKSTFGTMRGTASSPGEFPYSLFVLPIIADNVSDAKTETLTSRRGLVYYFSSFLTTNSYSRHGDMASPLTGEIAAMHATIRSNAFGGVAPSWLNENGMGGQLTSGRAYSQLLTLSNDDSKDLDDASINPVIQHVSYGTLITSRRSGQTGSLSDFSFIDNVSLTDYIIKNIVNNVLPIQITKPNDAINRARIRNLIDNIMQPLTIAPNNFIREYIIKCDEENNTDSVLAREEFIVDLGVKFTTKSRIIYFKFTNAAQTTSLEEVILVTF